MVCQRLASTFGCQRRSRRPIVGLRPKRILVFFKLFSDSKLLLNFGHTTTNRIFCKRSGDVLVGLAQVLDHLSHGGAELPAVLGDVRFDLAFEFPSCGAGVTIRAHGGMDGGDEVDARRVVFTG